jgi:ATP-dependent Clp protease ATP-binding subunit ClpA
MFERFTKRVRQAMALAQHEAQNLDSPFIGTEHLLLGLLGEGEGIAAQALVSLGVTADAVREQVRETTPAGPSRKTKTPPFTAEAKKTLELSLREALTFGHNYIGTEHVLLAIVRTGESGANALKALGVDLDEVKTRVINLLTGGTSVLQTLRTATWSRAAQAATRRAEAAAKARGEGVTTADLLSAILVDQDSQATRALAMFDKDAITHALSATPVEGTSDDPQWSKIEIKIGDGSKVITDPELAKALSTATLEQITSALRAVISEP